MRAAAKMSLLQVKQWAKSAEARGRPCGRSSRAARVSPPAPTNVTFTLFAAMTGSPLSLLSFRMAARLRGRDKPGGRLRCRIAGGHPAAARLRSPASAARPQPGDDSTVAARPPKPDPRVDILEKTTPLKGDFPVDRYRPRHRKFEIGRAHV